MSFFGFDPTLPHDRGHPTTAPGFGQTPDPFAGLARGRPLEDDDDDGYIYSNLRYMTPADKDNSISIDFDDTYDGLGDQLEEANDDFNDDTFGSGGENDAAAISKSVGKDFDFFGQTARVSDAINEEQMRFNRQQAPPKSVSSSSVFPPKQASKPVRTGYEKYNEPSYVADLQVDPTLWGSPARPSNSNTHGTGQQTSQGAPEAQLQNLTAVPSRKMMSLEEVEAAMRSKSKKPAASRVQQISQQQAIPNAPNMPIHQTQQKNVPRPTELPRNLQQQRLQPEQQSHFQGQSQMHIPQVELPAQAIQVPQNVPRSQPYRQPLLESREAGQPRQILQNPRRHQGEQSSVPVLQGTMMNQPQISTIPAPGFVHRSGIITHPQQLMQLSEEERAAFLIEDAKRAKRNHKIYLLSKDNGLMTPQDKNFITRIQLQQLMTATGNVEEQEPDTALAEDFYYQVHCQIRGGPRQNPHQPLSHFAQTYLFQTGGRQGGLGRRQLRGGDNHMQRMEQQVLRAVEAAKLKPKNKQLVMEGSLGKISFSNAKTPKPLLNIKRPESGNLTNRPQSAGRHASGRKESSTEMSASDRKTILRNIEAVYAALMTIEDHERREPPPPTEEADTVTVQRHMEWRCEMQIRITKLWDELKVMEAINLGSAIPHPFIALLSYPKGKKAIPRVFRHINAEQRTAMITMIIIHLDILDVIRLGQLRSGETQLPTPAREAIELFTQAVMPNLISFFSETTLSIVIGMLGLILERVNTQAIAQTKIGLGILTLLLSRAELLKLAGDASDEEWDMWSNFYDRLFNVLEPSLGGIFPGTINTGEDVYVWQFLAATGINASPEQQQRLVIAVK